VVAQDLLHGLLMNSQGARKSVEFMPCVAVTPSDEEDSFHGSSCDESGTMVETGSESASETEDEEELAEPDVVTCDLCGQAPCDWDTFGEEIWEECNNMKEAGSDNKAVRFHAYKMYTRLRHGVLRRFDRRPLPVCVRGEIMDSWPDPNHQYVGFQQAISDAAEGE
jgi:hypothetical protein